MKYKKSRKIFETYLKQWNDNKDKEIQHHNSKTANKQEIHINKSIK